MSLKQRLLSPWFAYSRPIRSRRGDDRSGPHERAPSSIARRFARSSSRAGSASNAFSHLPIAGYPGLPADHAGADNRTAIGYGCRRFRLTSACFWFSTRCWSRWKSPTMAKALPNPKPRQILEFTKKEPSHLQPASATILNLMIRGCTELPGPAVMPDKSITCFHRRRDALKATGKYHVAAISTGSSGMSKPSIPTNIAIHPRRRAGLAVRRIRPTRARLPIARH